MFLGPLGCDECEGVRVPDQAFSLGPAAQALSSDHSLFCLCLQSGQLLPAQPSITAQRTGTKPVQKPALPVIWERVCTDVDRSELQAGSGSRLG